MSMEEWPDDHLDELFRKSAEEFDAPYNPDDWEPMRRRLDEHQQQTWFDRISRWGGLGALLLVLIGGVSWVVLREKPASPPPALAATTPATRSQPTESSQSETAYRAAQPNGTNAEMPGQRGTSPEPDPSATAAVTDLKTPPAPPATNSRDSRAVEAAGARRETTAPTAVPASPLRPPLTPQPPPLATAVSRESRRSGKSVPADRQVAGSVPKPNQRTRRNKAGETLLPLNAVSLPVAEQKKMTRSAAGANALEPPVRFPIVAGVATLPPTDLATNQPDERWLPQLASVASLSGVAQQPAPLLSAIREPEEQVTAPIRRPHYPTSPWSVMLFASPDLSSIGLKNFDRPGSNAGLAVQYQLTNRLSINTGGMLSTKRYQTSSSEYVWPNPPLNAHLYVVPEAITGKCTLIDLPINLRYDWLLQHLGNGRAPARWFVSAGMTSYFIQHETYTYTFANASDPRIGTNTGWDNQVAGRPGGTFGFSNVNLSVGYERPITNRLSWQVEPFVKVPLQQIGVFRVKLLSTGAFVGLRYRL